MIHGSSTGPYSARTSSRSWTRSSSTSSSSNRWEELFHLGEDLEAQITYGPPPEEPTSCRTEVARRCTGIPVRAIAETAGLSLATVQAIWTREAWPSRDQLVKVERVLSELAEE